MLHLRLHTLAGYHGILGQHELSQRVGRMHIVGAILEPISVLVVPLLARQGSIGASPTGSPVDVADMLAFAARHGIAPKTEHKINEAFKHVADVKARYRVVLDADF